MPESEFSWKGLDHSDIHLERTPSNLFKAPPPRINFEDESTAAGTGWHDDFATIQWEDVKEWEDFSSENINEIFKGVNHEPVPWTEADEIKLRESRKKWYRIEFERDVNKMFEDSMLEVINKTMNCVCPRIRSGLGMEPMELETKFEGAKVKICREKGAGSLSKEPDWPIYKKYNSKRKPSHIYVAGEAKRDYVFKPEWLGSKVKYKKCRAHITLGQVGMYSYYGKTRYGFVITPASTTVLRYHFISKDAESLRLGVEYKVVPLSTQGSQLTATKAIVALAIMSMHDKQRDIVPKEQVLSLNTWYRYEANGGVVFAHLLTERLEPSLPSSAYTTSSKSAFNLLTHVCYQAMQTSVGIPCGSATAKKASKRLRLQTKTKSRKPETTLNVLKVVLEPGAKVSKSAKSRKGSSVISNEELSPTSLDDLNSIIRNFKASRKYRGRMVEHHRVASKVEEGQD